MFTTRELLTFLRTLDLPDMVSIFLLWICVYNLKKRKTIGWDEKKRKDLR